MPAVSPLTARQRQMLLAIWDHMATHGTYPTFRELGAVLGVTINAVAGHLAVLRKAGFIEGEQTERLARLNAPAVRVGGHRAIRLVGVRLLPVLDPEVGAALREILASRNPSTE